MDGWMDAWMGAESKRDSGIPEGKQECCMG